MAIIPGSGGVVVKSPRCIDPPKYGLLSVINPTSVQDLHWMASGIEFEDFLCSPGVTGFIDVCPPASGFTKPAERNAQFCSADPFVVVGSYQCPPVGRPSGEAFEIARQRLLSWEGHQAEQILWTGISANGSVNPSFAFGNPDCDILPEDVSPTGAVDLATAFSLLEGRLGDLVACGGVIHVPYEVVPYLVAQHLLLDNGTGEYFSPSGFRVVAGQGYPGSGPANVPAAAGEIWLFATGPLVIARSNVIMVPNEVSEAVDRQINNVTVRAERFYAIGFSCSLLAVRAELACAC